jgi:hypothetical protein
MNYHPLNQSTCVNYQPIGSIELKLLVANKEGYSIRANKTRYHHVVDGKVIISVDETKPTYYYYNGGLLLPCFDAYRTAMQYYLENKCSTTWSNKA